MPERLTENLIQSGLIDRARAEDAMQRQVLLGGALDTCLLEQKLVEERPLLDALAAAYGLPVAAAGEIDGPVDERALRAFPEQWAKKHTLAPLALTADHGALTVLSPAPPDIDLLYRLGELLEVVVRPVLAPEFRVHQRLALLYEERPPERFRVLIERALGRSDRPRAAERRTLVVTRPLSFGEAVTRLKEAKDRDEIVAAALAYAHRELDFAAMFIAHEHHLDGWNAVGTSTGRIQDVSIELARDSAFRVVLDTQAHYLGPLPDDALHADFLARLGRAHPRAALIVPVRIKSRTIALMYGENGPRTIPPRLAADLMLFITHVQSALEALLVRRKVETLTDLPSLLPRRADPGERDTWPNEQQRPEPADSTRRTWPVDQEGAAPAETAPPAEQAASPASSPPAQAPVAFAPEEPWAEPTPEAPAAPPNAAEPPRLAEAPWPIGQEEPTPVAPLLEEAAPPGPLGEAPYPLPELPPPALAEPAPLELSILAPEPTPVGFELTVEDPEEHLAPEDPTRPELGRELSELAQALSAASALAEASPQPAEPAEEPGTDHGTRLAELGREAGSTPPPELVQTEDLPLGPVEGSDAPPIDGSGTPLPLLEAVEPDAAPAAPTRPELAVVAYSAEDDDPGRTRPERPPATPPPVPRSGAYALLRPSADDLRVEAVPVGRMRPSVSEERGEWDEVQLDLTDPPTPPAGSAFESLMAEASSAPVSASPPPDEARRRLQTTLDKDLTPHDAEGWESVQVDTWDLPDPTTKGRASADTSKLRASLTEDSTVPDLSAEAWLRASSDTLRPRALPPEVLERAHLADEPVPLTRAAVLRGQVPVATPDTAGAPIPLVRRPSIPPQPAEPSLAQRTAGQTPESSPADDTLPLARRPSIPPMPPPASSPGREALVRRPSIPPTRELPGEDPPGAADPPVTLAEEPVPLTRRTSGITRAESPLSPPAPEEPVPLTRRSSGITRAESPLDAARPAPALVAPPAPTSSADEIPVAEAQAGHPLADELSRSRSSQPRDARSPARQEAEMDRLLDQLESQDPGVRRQARDLLLGMGSFVLPKLVERFPGPITLDPFAPQASLPSFGECGELLGLLASFGLDAHPYVVRRIDAPSPLARFFAIHFYSQVFVPEAIPRLMQRLHDEEQRICLLAARTLFNYRELPEFLGVLSHIHDRLRASSLAARRHAAYLIGLFRDVSAVPLLLDLFDKKDKAMFDSAEAALAEITKQRLGASGKKWHAWWERNKGRSRIGWLVDGLGAKDSDLRRSAADELRAITGHDFGYDEDAPKRQRDEARLRWIHWWAEQSRLQGRPDTELAPP